MVRRWKRLVRRAALATGALVLLSACATPVPQASPLRLRVATYNISFFADTDGGLATRLRAGDEKARQVAAVIQRVRPDVILLNEFDYEADGTSAQIFLRDYLGVAQPGAVAISYEYQYQAPVNTGVPSGLDLDLDGRKDGPADAWGFGKHPGQYGMLVLSRYPIDRAAVRSFQHFLWKDMPGALAPINADGSRYYTPEVWAKLRLSSKSHWDLPINTPLGRLHFLTLHPTPPVFDGPEDRNGRRNHDEIRLMADYVHPDRSHYLVDDQGRRGGLAGDAQFVIAGDLNSDPSGGDSVEGAIQQLLRSPRVDAAFAPTSPGAAASQNRPSAKPANSDAGLAARTASFGLRVDYVLPSRGLKVVDGAVFWPAPNDPDAALATASDHHLVWIDLVQAQ